MDLTVANAPSQDLAFTNCVYVTQSTLSTLGGDKELYGEIKGLIYTLKPHDGMQANCIGLNSIQRRILSVSAGETLTVAVFPQRDAHAALRGDHRGQLRRGEQASARSDH